ncbi:hypothetical protein F5X99DRAFT_110554 [Biscogniauxia marginata]|nr:hypothetical protein F5X99DRAFT_110554 [Biscogniauxia marginata]
MLPSESSLTPYHISSSHTTTITYDHRTQNTRHPVRSALDKLGTARLVVGSVTTSESLVFVTGSIRSAIGNGKEYEELSSESYRTRERGYVLVPPIQGVPTLKHPNS